MSVRPDEKSAAPGWVVENRGAPTMGEDDSCHSTAASCDPVGIRDLWSAFSKEAGNWDFNGKSDVQT